MNTKKLLLAAAAVLMVSGSSAALADPGDHGRPMHHDMDRHDDRAGHDRYWRPDYRGGYVDRDHVFLTLRQNHYRRFVGDPYWFQGRYVEKAYRHGHVVYLEVNPYTGGFIGEVSF